MVKILTGMVALIVVAVGGFFGFQFYTQHRIASEIDAAFEQIRASGGKATHGPVSFDLKSRTVTIADIVGQTAAQPPVSFRITSLTAAGVGQPDAARFSADDIEITDIEIDAAMATPPGLIVTYKVPRITVKDYSGPASLQRPPASSSFFDVYRFGLEQFAAVTATSITAPNVAGTMKFGAATPGSGEVAYSGFAMQGIKDGKIASTKVDGFVFTVNLQQAGKAEKLTGTIANIASYDVDIGAMAAMFDPQKANDDKSYRAYRQITAGPYTLTSGQGISTRIDGMTIDDVEIKPSKLQLPALLAMLPPPGAAPPTPAQAREMMEKVAKLYEGIHVGNAEMRDLSLQTPQGPVKLSAMRFNFDGGKIGELAFEGLDAHSPKGPVKLGRFALKSLDISGLMRMAAEFAGQKPSPEQVAGLLTLLEGIEVKGVVAPFKDTGKPVTIDTFDLNWGQFIGPIPSKLHLTAKMSTPVDPSDPKSALLVAAGLNMLAADCDINAAWTEASRTFVLDAAAFDIDGLAKLSARVSLGNVPRGVFSTNAPQAMAMAAQIEAGTLEFTLHDVGGVDIVIAQYARGQNVSREAARSSIVDGIRASSEKTAAANPDAAAAVEALARFVETPGQTLIIKLTPRGKVPVLQLTQLLKTDPFAALAQFKIEASTSL